MKKFIDVRRILKEKNPKLEKRAPKFFVKYLERIFHEKEVNTIIEENKDLYNYEFASDLVKRFGLKFNLIGSKNIPSKGGVIFVVNHPLGGFDALMLAHEIAPIRKDAKFIANDVLMNFKNINGLMVGVNKHGVKTKNSISQINDLFASDNAVFIFPAGLVSRRNKGKVRDSEWKKTFVARAKKFKRDVIPMYIDGELSNFFYRLSSLRKKLGFKKNIEMLYLANETFKLKNKEFTLTVGEAINYKKFDGSKTDLEWAAEVKDVVYNLKS